MSLDSLKSSHPVEVPVVKAQEVDEIFDSISYSKGASIIRMLVAFLGEEDFRKGMVLYLNRHKYSNAATEDLWKALSEYSKKDVKQFMDRWTKTMGYPVLSLSDEIKDNKVPVSQSWFLADGSAEEKADEGSWYVPVKVTSSSGVSDMTLLNQKSGHIPVADGSKWFKLNSFQEGLYR
jgi:aminopeptidase 2